MQDSSFRNLYQLKGLNMEGCTMLEVLPVNINLPNLEELNLSGCSKLRNFPQISTRIECLYLDDTGIEEIPSWIKNMSSLQILKMRRCKNLKNVSADIFKLEHRKADFSDCGGITTICDNLPGPHNDFFDISLYISLYSYFEFPRVTPFKFYNCFNLNRDAQEIIIQSYLNMVVIPGGKVPMYFTHRASGSSLTAVTREDTCMYEIYCDVEVDTCMYEMNHLVLFILHLQIIRVDNSPSELDKNVLLLEFYNSHYDEYYEGCSCGSYGSHKQNSTLVDIKGCGARVMNITKTDFRENDEESNRSKKKMRMTVLTSQDHSNSLSIQTAVNSEPVAPNLELSFGLAGGSGEVSSGSKVPSPSRNFCGDGASSFDPCLGGESLHFEPMIIEQQNTGTSDEDPSFSPQLNDSFT